MYRDPLAAALGRIDAARDVRDRAWREVRGLIEGIDVLRAQLSDKGIDPPAPPVVDAPVETSVAPETISLADALRAAEVVEKDGARIAEAAARLAILASVLGDRLAGKSTHLPLGPPPRAVPWRYALAEALPGWLLLGVPGAAAAGEFLAVRLVGHALGPAAAVCVAAPVFVLVLGMCVRAHDRVAFLRDCRVAASVKLERRESTSTKNTNVPMRTARGWDVKRESYTGYTMKNYLSWMGEDGRMGELVVRGTPYDEGVVLYDDTRALCVVSLHSAPRPDLAGAWERRLPTMVWVRLVTLFLMLAALASIALGPAGVKG